jgi:hypothetical protein
MDDGAGGRGEDGNDLFSRQLLSNDVSVMLSVRARVAWVGPSAVVDCRPHLVTRRRRRFQGP